MYFTRKKNTVNATLFHLDNFSQEGINKHLTDVYKTACDSISSVTDKSSSKPIHLVIPMMYNALYCDELLFTSARCSIVTDVFGSYSGGASGGLYPKIVVDNLFSDEASMLMQDSTIEKGYKKKSIFTKEPEPIRVLGHYLNPDLPLQTTEDDRKQGYRMYNKLVTNYACSQQVINRRAIKTDEKQIIDNLLPNGNKKINKNYPNSLLSVDYVLSLSELGEFMVTLLRLWKKTGYQYQGDSGDMLQDTYGSLFHSLICDISNYNHQTKSIAFIDKLCERLGVKDKTVIANLNNYVIKKSTSIYDDFIKEANDFNMNIERPVPQDETIQNINNTFVPITFMFYMKVHPELFNKPDHVVKYSHSLTRPSFMKGNVSYFNTSIPQDNYYSDTYTTIFTTTILPVNFASLILRSKMLDLANKQLFMEVPDTDLLTSQYTLLHNPEFKEDFIFYDNDKGEKIVKYLTSQICRRFDNNIQVLYLPHLPAQYPLSMYGYRSAIDRTFDMPLKETLFDYLGIDIDYNSPIQTSIDKIKALFETYSVLGSLIPKDIENYVYTWLIVLYLQNNILFRYNHPDFKKRIHDWYTNNTSLISELQGGWRSDFLSNEWDSYRSYSHIVGIYPFLLETVYRMIKETSIHHVVTCLKLNILPAFEKETKLLINSISNLYRTKEITIDWEKERDLDMRNSLSRVEGSSHSIFNKIEHLLYRQFNINLSHIASRGLYNDNYEELLIHLLKYVKAFHYFRSMRSCFNGFLHTSSPDKFLTDNWKQLNAEYKGSAMHGPNYFELGQIVVQYRAKNPKTPTSNLGVEELYKWYESTHLNFLTATF
jgi:hypothetical protein